MAKPERISSAANPLIKDVQRAVARGGLTADGCAVAETFHLLEEALGSRCAVEAVLVSDSAFPAVEAHLARLRDARVAVMPDALFQSVAATQTSQGVMALVRPRVWDIAQLFEGNSLVVALNGLQDPGNAGAICRAAEAFGATGVLFLKGTVSPHNPKALRAAAGSLFRLPCLAGMDAAEARAVLGERGLDLWAAVPSRGGAGARHLWDADLARPCALIIGSEAHGVEAHLRAAAADISIPTTGVESLNAALAAGILLYEARRQRSRKP